MFEIGLTLIAIAVIWAVIAKPKITIIEKSRFFPRRPLTEPEQILYWRLVNALPNYIVLPQVSFSRFLYTKGGTDKENFSKLARARQKVADFLICEKSFYIVAICELDDSSHNPLHDQNRDGILKEAGLRVIRWKTTQLPTEAEIKTVVTGV